MLLVVGVGPASLADLTVFMDPTIGTSFQDAQESAFLAATYGLTTINFDDQIPDAMLTGNEYAGLGITFSQPGGHLLHALTANANFTPHSAPNSLFPYDVSATDERLQLDLATAQFAVGMWVMDSEFVAPGATETLDFYDASNGLIASLPLPRTDYITGGPDGNFFMGVVSSVPIARVILNESVGEIYVEDVGWDDVYFGAPEPTSLALLALGSFCLRRRR
jgi:hypothetical protein